MDTRLGVQAAPGASAGAVSPLGRDATSRPDGARLRKAARWAETSRCLPSRVRVRRLELPRRPPSYMPMLPRPSSSADSRALASRRASGSRRGRSSAPPPRRRCQAGRRQGRQRPRGRHPSRGRAPPPAARFPGVHDGCTEELRQAHGRAIRVPVTAVNDGQSRAARHPRQATQHQVRAGQGISGARRDPIPKPCVAGSNPAGGTKTNCVTTPGVLIIEATYPLRDVQARRADGQAHRGRTPVPCEHDRAMLPGRSEVADQPVPAGALADVEQLGDHHGAGVQCACHDGGWPHQATRGRRGTAGTPPPSGSASPGPAAPAAFSCSGPVCGLAHAAVHVTAAAPGNTPRH